ncbi:MAG: DUF86 domain-containing protein [Pseudomonadota bacterium]
MTPGVIRATVVAERVAWVRKMVDGIRNLSFSTYDEFISDPRNGAAAESYLRRALEALLDLGRHILAKGFALAPTEYKEIAQLLVEKGILSSEEGRILRELAGYRNRMVHFYHEITQQELYGICITKLSDLESTCEAILCWLREHPNRIDSMI